MNILTNKFKEHFKNSNTKYIKRLLRQDVISIKSVVKLVDLEELNYTFEDFLFDGYAENTIEGKALYNLYDKGYSSMNEYSKQHGYKTLNLSQNVYYGFARRYKVLLDVNDDFFELIELDYDIDNFRLELYQDHIELYGDRKELECFRKSHDIKYIVRYEFMKNEYHLAFDGFVAEYIRYKEKG